MNSKMTTNSQLSTTKPKETKSKTNSANNWNRKQSNRNRSHGGLSVGRGKGRMREGVHGIRRIIGRYKIDRER